MQQDKKNIYERLGTAITSILWVAGLLIAGSDNIYMPWINGIGLVLFLFSSIMLGRFLRATHSPSTMVVFPKFYQRPAISKRVSSKKNCRVNTRYALGAR